MPSEEQHELVMGPNCIKVVVKGTPVPKKRPGWTRHGRAYNGSAHLEHQFAEVCRLQFAEVSEVLPYFGVNETMRMNVVFHFPVKGSSYDARVRSLTAKGDIDNFVKFVQDALQGTFYPNDKNIVTIYAEKIGYTHAEVGWVEVEIIREQLVF